MLSPTDRAFQKTNGVLDLYAFHQACKQLLIRGRDSPYIQDLLRWYQARIFGTGKVSETQDVEAPQNYGHVVEDFLWQLRAAVPAGNAVAGPSSSSLMAPPASLVVQQGSVAHLVPESSRSDSESNSDSGSGSGSGSGSDSDSDSDADSGSSSHLSDDEGVGGMDGEELYRNIGEIQFIFISTQ